jgi:hypothetical protein
MPITQADKVKLNDIIERLKDVQRVAPVVTTYRNGKTESSISHELLAITRDLEKMVSVNATRTNRKANP